ncbi:hypothetical protein ACQP0U_28765 [Micromonospora sp. CA-269861]|uniref:hypothetical protein n=1 Tax=Micromonospora sp. CA-269861 TaxID=3239968 RepID=UPI003D8B5320
MSSVGYRQLWAADPDGWRATGAAWAGLTGPLDRRVGGLRTAGGRLGSGWSGAAATAADTRLAGLRDELTSIAPALIEVDQVLAELAGRLTVAKARLTEAVAQADAAGLLVDRSGGVRVDPARVRPADLAGRTAAGVAVTGVAAILRAALDGAAAADRVAADRLDELARAAGTGWASPPPPGRPAPGAAPALVNAWWSGLTPRSGGG